MTVARTWGFSILWSFQLAPECKASHEERRPGRVGGTGS